MTLPLSADIAKETIDLSGLRLSKFVMVKCAPRTMAHDNRHSPLVAVTGCEVCAPRPLRRWVEAQMRDWHYSIRMVIPARWSLLRQREGASDLTKKWDVAPEWEDVMARFIGRTNGRHWVLGHGRLTVRYLRWPDPVAPYPPKRIPLLAEAKVLVKDASETIANAVAETANAVAGMTTTRTSIMDNIIEKPEFRRSR